MIKNTLCLLFYGGLLFCTVNVTASATGLEEIIVTAQKYEQQAKDIGMSINAFSGETLKTLGISETADLALITPGFTVSESQGTAIPVYTMRGVGFNESSLQATATVGVYNDEIALPFPVMTIGPLMDIARVEILKGPQGTLYGMNSTGGTINYITNKPTDTFEAGVTLDYGRYNTGNIEGHVSGPLSDSVRARIAFKTTQSSEGWQHSVSRDEKLGKKDKSGVRLLVEADLSESIDATLSVNWWEDKSDSQAPQAIRLEYQTLSNSAAISQIEKYWMIDSRDKNSLADWTAATRPKMNLESHAVSLRLNWRATDNLTLTSLTSVAKFEDNGSIYNRDGWGGAPSSDPEVADLIPKLSLAGGYIPPAYLENGVNRDNSKIDAFSQELRMSGDINKLTWVGGVYFSKDEVDTINHLTQGLTTNTNPPGGGLGGFQAVDKLANSKGKAWALFAHTEWSLSDKTKLVLGARQTRDEKDFIGCSQDVHGDVSTLFAAIFNSGAVPGGCVTLLEDAPIPTSGMTYDSLNESSTSGKVALDYNLDENTLVYLSYSRGFKSGSFPTVTASLGVQLNPVVQEKLDAYELGFKATLFDNSVQLNGAVFYYDYTDKQLLTKIPTVFGSLFTLGNIPKSQVQGLELDLQMQPLQGLFMSFGGSYVETKIKEFTGYTQTGLSAVDLSGSEFPFTPKVELAALINYERPVGDGLVAFIGSDVSYTGSSQTDYASDDAPLRPIFKSGSYTLVGLRVGIHSTEDIWNLSFWGRNITDEFYAASIAKNTDSILRYNGMPATYGVTFSYNWF